MKRKQKARQIPAKTNYYTKKNQIKVISNKMVEKV